MKKGQSPTDIKVFSANLAKVTEIDCARLASFIDGEGTIYINRSRPRGGHKSRTHALSVTVKNNSELLMSWLRDTFMGSVLPDRGGLSPLTKRPGWTWRLNERQAEILLERCLPYFIIKRQQAEIGLAFRDLKRGTSYAARKGRVMQCVPEVELRRRDALRDQIHELNSPSATVRGVIN
jgi:hypothetical protein